MAGAEDIFWFEFNDNPVEALDISAQTLEHLSEYIEEVSLLEEVSRTAQKLFGSIKKIRAAVAKNY